MRTVVHFVKPGTHIQHVVVFIHQRDVNGSAPAVVRANRDIHHVFRIGAGIPELRLCLLRAIGVVDHQLQTGQRGDTDRFRQRGGGIRVQQARGVLIDRAAGNVIGGRVFQIDMQRGKSFRHINQLTLFRHSSAPLAFKLTKFLL